MDDEVVFMVRGKTRAACQRELDWLCKHRGATATRPPTDMMPPGWVGRVVVAPLTDDETVPGHE